MKKNITKLKSAKGMPALQQKMVERLARGLVPVKPRPSPVVQWLSWLAFTVVVISLLIFFMPLRPDLSFNLASLPFDLMMFCILLGAALSSWGAIEGSIPGEEQIGKRKLLLSSILWAGAGLLFLLFLPWNAEKSIDQITSFHCYAVAFLVGLVFWVGLGFLVRKNAPVNARRVGLWSGVSSFLLGLGVTTLNCPSQNLYHVLIEHFLPVLVYSWLMGWLGIWWVSSWKRKALPPTQ